MLDSKKSFKTVDEYIQSFPKDVAERLEQIRQTVKKAAPDAQEVISYNMPLFKQNGRLVYFAGYKNHIGFYPMTGAIKKFNKEISVYKWSKGSVQFPNDKPIPYDLIKKMIEFRVKENSPS